MKAYETVKRDIVYEGKIINVAQDIITLPDGREALREIVLHNGAAAIVAVDSDGMLIFVRQYRHPCGDMVLEIPAGTLERNEDPKVCAARELEEETGFTANKWSFINKMFSAIGFCTEVLHIYLAEGLVPGKQSLDEDEFVTIEKYSLDQAVAMILNGKIIDAKTIASVLAYKEILSRR